MKPLLVLISGAPGTGKTDLGRRIATALHWPFIHRDGIKERLFDSLGWQDRAWSKRLGAAAYDLLYHFVEIELQASRSFVVESNFEPRFDTRRFLALQRQYPFEPLQIQCKTDPEILVARFKTRSTSGERHPGHVDYLNIDDFEPTLLQAKHASLEIGGEVVEVDTTDFAAIDYEGLHQIVRRTLSSLAE